jgi:hypothetical protein
MTRFSQRKKRRDEEEGSETVHASVASKSLVLDWDWIAVPVTRDAFVAGAVGPKSAFVRDQVGQAPRQAVLTSSSAPAFLCRRDCTWDREQTKTK